jgi:hypothetical protein
MKIEQTKWNAEKGWVTIRKDQFDPSNSNLVIVFGSRELLGATSCFDEIKMRFQNANIILNSTSGEIIDTQVNDDSLSITAIQFEKTTMQTAEIDIRDFQNSFDAGCALSKQFKTIDLSNIIVISDGHLVNGSDLVQGLISGLPPETIITGGLAGDGSKFEKTLVGLNSFPTEGKVVAVGFYGTSLKVSHGSMGGWDPFGPERMITKSIANVLYELDGQPALDVYKKYLGEYSKDLPGSGLLFPLCIKSHENDEPVVRTILGINEDEQSLTFAGNVPEHSYARLMKANFDRLIEGASNAAHSSLDIMSKPDLAILISCVGRKLVLNQRIEEEVEAVREIFGNTTAITGFYSYGEISPFAGFKKCEFHNQSMTITTMTEQ